VRAGLTRDSCVRSGRTWTGSGTRPAAGAAPTWPAWRRARARS